MSQDIILKVDNLDLTYIRTALVQNIQRRVSQNYAQDHFEILKKRKLIVQIAERQGIPEQKISEYLDKAVSLASKDIESSLHQIALKYISERMNANDEKSLDELEWASKIVEKYEEKKFPEFSDSLKECREAYARGEIEPVQAGHPTQEIKDWAESVFDKDRKDQENAKT